MSKRSLDEINTALDTLNKKQASAKQLEQKLQEERKQAVSDYLMECCGEAAAAILMQALRDATREYAAAGHGTVGRRMLLGRLAERNSEYGVSEWHDVNDGLSVRVIICAHKPKASSRPDWAVGWGEE